MSKIELDNRVASTATRTATEHKVQQITTRTDSREILANARRDIARLHLDDYFYPYDIVEGDPVKDFPDKASYAQYGNGLSIGDWRRSRSLPEAP